jgi:P-type E1-E2 ATPase
MGIVNTLVYVTGGLSICYVNFKNQMMLFGLAKIDGTCQVLRDGKVSTISTTDIVPGDVVVVSPGSLSCDLVLLQGQVLVDESSLTGESMPVAKTPIENLSVEYSPISHKKSTLFAGTIVLELDSNPSSEKIDRLALVMKTGANTSKGEQLRNIMFSSTPLFKFDIQVRIVIGILILYAIFGFVITLHFLATDKISG